MSEEKGWSLQYVREQQDACPVLKEVKKWLPSRSVPEANKVQGRELRAFHRELSNLILDNDKVLRYVSRKSEETSRVVIPASLKEKALRMLHNDAGHFGGTKTLHRARDRYFWPFMAADVDNWCTTCKLCQQRRNLIPGNTAPLQPIVTTRPGELVTLDIVEYPKSQRGSQYCLVMIDHFTKWLELFPLRNQKAETIAKKIMDGWIPHHGAPEQLHSDQGKNLTGKVISEICKSLEVLKTRTTPFHPQSDGASERSIRTVNAMLSKVVESDQRNWDLYLSSTSLAYNTAVHSSTNFTPCYLEFGRELRLPNDLVEPLHVRSEAKSQSDFASQVRSRLERAYKVATESLSMAHNTQKHYYDRWARARTYKKGELVLWLDNIKRQDVGGV